MSKRKKMTDDSSGDAKLKVAAVICTELAGNVTVVAVNDTKPSQVAPIYECVFPPCPVCPRWVPMGQEVLIAIGLKKLKKR